MAKKEKATDLWVYDLLKEANLSDKLEPQGSSILEINYGADNKMSKKNSK